MRIDKIKIDKWKCLEDINISFFRDMAPQIFIIGAYNGGGKTTLLELIFNASQNLDWIAGKTEQDGFKIDFEVEPSDKIIGSRVFLATSTIKLEFRYKTDIYKLGFIDTSLSRDKLNLFIAKNNATNSNLLDANYFDSWSTGETKRLGLYFWLTESVPPNSIVLIDNIEDGFHPDSQYNLINDLLNWAPSNQYILASHSYDLCSALTPQHVIVIDKIPK